VCQQKNVPAKNGDGSNYNRKSFQHSKIPIVNDKNCIFLGLLAEFQPIIIRLNIANDETGETESGNQNKISVFYNSQLVKPRCSNDPCTLPMESHMP